MASCKSNNSSSKITLVSADKLIENIDKHVNTKVETEGRVAHICGVDGLKLKLMSDNGEVIVLVPQDTTRFDRALNGKRVRVCGIVQETRLSDDYINEKENEKALLCHVDLRPCKDTNWVNAHIEAGSANDLAKKDIEKLRQKKEAKGYVSVVTIVAEKWEIVGNLD